MPRHNKILRFTMFKQRILVYKVAKRDVIEVVFSADEDIEFFVQHSKLSTAHQAPEVQLTENTVKLTARHGAVVNAVVIFKQGEHLNTTLTHTVCETVHHHLKHLISILCEAVQI